MSCVSFRCTSSQNKKDFFANDIVTGGRQSSDISLKCECKEHFLVKVGNQTFYLNLDVLNPISPVPKRIFLSI